MQIAAMNRSIRAGGALMAALAFASAQAAPQSREDSVPTESSAAVAEDNGDTAAAAAAANAAAALSNPPVAKAATAAAKPASAPAVEHRDLGRSIREVSKPMLDELAHSDVAEAVRALDINRPSTVDAGLDDNNPTEDNADPGARRRNWDGSGQRQARDNSVQQTAVNRDPERDKARAAMLMSGLIEEIKPWAFGAAVLYVLAYIAKFSLAARRRTVQRRMERRKYNRRTRHSQHSQNSQRGRP